MEMVKGLQQVQRPQKITDLLTHVAAEHILDFTQPEAELAGRIWGDLERTGQRIGQADPMIAAIALRTASNWQPATFRITSVSSS